MYRLVNSSSLIVSSLFSKANLCMNYIPRRLTFYSSSSAHYFLQKKNLGTRYRPKPTFISSSFKSTSSSSSSYVFPNRLLPMNHWTVIKAIAPIVQEHLLDVSFIDIFASLVALQKYQIKQNGKHSIEYLPGKSAMRNSQLDSTLLSNAFRMCKYATATYGWKGHLFFWLTDPDASFAISSVARSTLTGDTDAFLTIAGITHREQLVYSSSSVEIGIPKHFIVVDDSIRTIVLTIRGTLSLSDALTDALAREVPFCGGYAHEGIAFAAKTIYESTREILEKEFVKHPGYTLMITGHSLGAGTAMLYTILVNYERQNNKQQPNGGTTIDGYPFPGIVIECHAFAAPPVFSPLSVLPSTVSSSIISWIHREDIIPRLTLQGLIDLIRLCKKVSDHHPSLTGRFLKNDIELQSILETEPDWLRSWNRDPSKIKSDETYGSDSNVVSNDKQRNDNVSNTDANNCNTTKITTQGSSIDSAQRLSSDSEIDSSIEKKEDENLQQLELEQVRLIVTQLQQSSSSSLSRSSSLLLSSPSSPPSDSGTTNGTTVPSTVSSSTVTKTDIPRLQLPGTLFCFRAPMEVNMDTKIVNEVVSSSSSSNNSSSGKSSSTQSAFFGFNPTTMVSSVSSWVDTTTNFVGSTVTALSDNIKNIVNNNSTATRSDRLPTDITLEATERAKIDPIPYITVCSPDELRNLPITDTAWRDHIPDQYLFVLRQLMEIANNQQQQQVRNERTSIVPRDSRTNYGVTTIDIEDEPQEPPKRKEGSI